MQDLKSKEDLTEFVNYLSQEEMENKKLENSKVCYLDYDDNKVMLCDKIKRIGDHYSKLNHHDALLYNKLLFPHSISEKTKITVPHFYRDEDVFVDIDKVKKIDLEDEYNEIMNIPIDIKNKGEYQRKKIKKFLKDIGRKRIKILKTPVETSKMSFKEAEDLALDYTKWAGVEVSFYYDKEKNVTSPIFTIGYTISVPPLLSLITDYDKIFGDFHTHPKEKKFSFEKSEDDECMFTKQDVMHFLDNEDIQDATVVCGNNERLSLRVRDIRGDDLITELKKAPGWEKDIIEKLIQKYGKKAILIHKYDDMRLYHLFSKYKW